MWLRITIDLDMKVHDAEAVTDSGPYPHCGDITPNFKRLIGVTIAIPASPDDAYVSGATTIDGWKEPRNNTVTASSL